MFDVWIVSGNLWPFSLGHSTMAFSVPLIEYPLDCMLPVASFQGNTIVLSI